MNPELTGQLIRVAIVIALGVVLDVAYWRWRKRRAQAQRPDGVVNWLAAWGEKLGSVWAGAWGSVMSKGGAAVAWLRPSAPAVTVKADAPAAAQRQGAASPMEMPATTPPEIASSPPAVAPETFPPVVPTQGVPEAEVTPPPASEAGATQTETRQITMAASGTAEATVAVAPGQAVHVQVAMDVPEGMSVRVTVEASSGDLPAVVAAPAAPPVWAPRGLLRPAPVSRPAVPVGDALREAWDWGRATWIRLRAVWQRQAILAGTLLFGLSLLIYAVTRLWALDQFPIYFFADEANLTVMADDLIAHGLHGTDGALLPLYFDAAGNRWTPVLPVYFQALALAFFGKSIVVSRATSALVTLLGVAAVGLSLKWVFKLRYWWTSTLLLAIMPAWFLHSRTAFETASTTALFAGFLLCYLLYRERSPRYIYAAVGLGAATFYSYSNAQVVVAAAAGLLFLSDLPYHWKQRRHVLGGLALAVVLSWPLVSFWLRHPDALQTHLHAVDSYMYKALSLGQKIGLYAQKYTLGLSPQYWFWPNSIDLPRHRMAGMGHIGLALLPLVALGLLVCLVQFRSARYRAVVLAALAAPAGAALLDIGVTRVLTFVIPAGMLAALGLEFILVRLRRVPQWVLAGGAFVILSAASFSLLRTALVDGPLWFRDYGLYGMQFGAKQLFQDAVPTYLAREPDIVVGISSSWANGTDNFLRFFFTPAQLAHVRMLGVEDFLFNKRDLTPNILLVMTPAEYEVARTNPKFKSVAADQVIPYPDGTPGFYFARLAYADNADAIFAAEREERRKPVTEAFQLDGQTVTISHSRFGAGQLTDVFDGDRFTLVRGLEANPLVFDLTFSQPRPVTEVSGDFGTMQNFSLIVKVSAPGASDPMVFSQDYVSSTQDPHYDLPLPAAPPLVARLRIEVRDNAAGDTAQIHVRNLDIR